MSCIRSCYDKNSSNFEHDDCKTCIHGDRPQQRTAAKGEDTRRAWVGLTDEEIDYQAKKDDHGFYFALGALWAQSKLKEKNNGT